MYVQRDIEVRSCNHCWSGKAISVTYSANVFVALRIQHVTRTRHIGICRLSSYNFFSHYLIKQKGFRGGEGGGNKYWTKCVFWISLQIFVSNIFHSKENCAVYDQKWIFVLKWGTLYSCQIFMKLEFYRYVFLNTQISNFIKFVQ